MKMVSLQAILARGVILLIPQELRTGGLMATVDKVGRVCIIKDGMGNVSEMESIIFHLHNNTWLLVYTEIHTPV